MFLREESQPSAVSNIFETAKKDVPAFDPRCESDDEDGSLLVVNDTDESDLETSSEFETMTSSLKWTPAIKRDPYPVEETLWLTFEEV